MHKLTIIDFENFILEGEFERFKAPPRALLDTQSIQRAVEDYNVNQVKKGLAFGHLNDGFLIMPTVDGEKVDTSEKDPAFMIVDVEYNGVTKGVKGKILILDTEDGLKIKQGIKKGMNCYISSSESTEGSALDKDKGRLVHKIMHLGGYRLSMLDY